MQEQQSYYSSYSISPDFSIKTANENNVYPLDVELLKNLLEIQSPSRNEHDIQMFLINWINDNIPTASLKVDESGNLLVEKRTTDVEFVPAFASHMDEVNSLQTGRSIIDLGNVLVGINPKTGKSAGCPGDDGVGLYICLEMLRILDDVKCAFFIAEEVGCVGSSAVDLKFFDDAIFVLQADRRDASDFITHTNGTSVSSKDFQDMVKTHLDMYDFKVCENGSSTDVGKLVTRGVGICCANLSSGYYNAHSLEEKVCKSDVENTMNMMYKIATDPNIISKRWVYEPPKTTTTYRSTSSYYSKKNEEKGGSDFDGQSFQCNSCPDHWSCLTCPVARDNKFYS